MKTVWGCVGGSNEGLTLETSAFVIVTVANLPLQLCWYIQFKWASHLNLQCNRCKRLIENVSFPLISLQASMKHYHGIREIYKFCWSEKNVQDFGTTNHVSSAQWSNKIPVVNTSALFSAHYHKLLDGVRYLTNPHGFFKAFIETPGFL